MVNWLAITLGIVPSLVWLLFFLQEDRKNPEPKRLIISTFLLGMAIPFVVLKVQVLFADFSGSFGIREFSPFSIFWLAGIEEFFKFLAVYLWVSKRKEFDEPIDPMIYMIVAALGFAAVENIASASQSIAGFELITLRFVGATLLHSLSSSLVGFYWAMAIVNKTGVFKGILTGLFYATLLHSIFNSMVLIFGPAFHVTMFLVFIGFFILKDFEQVKRLRVALTR